MLHIKICSLLFQQLSKDNMSPHNMGITLAQHEVYSEKQLFCGMLQRPNQEASGTCNMCSHFNATKHLMTTKVEEIYKLGM